MRVCNFGDDMVMSDGHASNTAVKSILMSLVPGSLSVHRAAATNDRSGTDYWVEVVGRHLSVDVKVRAEDWAMKVPPQDDLALETWSVKGEICKGLRDDSKRIVGWSRDAAKRTDYVLWLWQESGRFCLVPFPFLCRVFDQHYRDWAERYKVRTQFTKRGGGPDGWFSECVFVPRVEVWREIYRQFSPNPDPPPELT
jgi:hypothetical protein